jgi:hypothetical protein
MTTEQIKNNAEIVALLEEMKAQYAVVTTDGHYQWQVLWNKFGDEPEEIEKLEIISTNSSLLEALKEAKVKRWKL